MVNARTTTYDAPLNAQIETRDEANAWAATVVHYGSDGRIVQIAINKGTFDTYPLDEVAISEMQDMHGMAIVKIGYPDNLIKSGYNNEDFIAATKDYWDRFGDDIECEITPVVVKVVPITLSKRYSETNPYSKYMGQEFPMILVKTGRNYQKGDAGFITGTFTDQFSHSESVSGLGVWTHTCLLKRTAKWFSLRLGRFPCTKNPSWKRGRNAKLNHRKSGDTAC
jgi:hypothetical protein